MITDERELILEEEWLMVRDSGEIPEIALHSTLHYLCHDPEGPRIALSAEELDTLYSAVGQRYLEIILRDLIPDTRFLSMYRGVARAIVNWKRLSRFCLRVQLDTDEFIPVVSQALQRLIEVECQERAEGRQEKSGFNCSGKELCLFLDSLEIKKSSLPVGWEELGAS